MKTTKLLLLVVVITGFISCAKNEEKQNNTQNKTVSTSQNSSFAGNTSKILEVNGVLSETEVPLFSWMDEKSRKINLSDYRGKVIIINFWATWCGPCKSEIPDFVKIYSKYRNQGVDILGISLDSELSLEELASFVGENDITYQIIHDNGELQAAFGDIKAIPTTYIIGKDFKVKNHFIGALSEEQLEKLIKLEL